MKERYTAQLTDIFFKENPLKIKKKGIFSERNNKDDSKRKITLQKKKEE